MYPGIFSSTAGAITGALGGLFVVGSTVFVPAAARRGKRTTARRRAVRPKRMYPLKGLR